MNIYLHVLIDLAIIALSWWFTGKGQYGNEEGKYGSGFGFTVWKLCLVVWSVTLGVDLAEITNANN